MVYVVVGILAYLVGAIIWWLIAGTDKPIISTSVTVVDDEWGRRLASCQVKAALFHEVGSATTSNAVHKWLTDISNQIDQQLVIIDELAKLGRSLDPKLQSGPPEDSTTAKVWERLREFEDGLETSVTSAVQVRLNTLSSDVNLMHIRQQLDMLEAQLPSFDA